MKKLTLKLRDEISLIEFKGTTEVNELYVNAGLKSRSNNIVFKCLDRVARRRAFRKRELWDYSKQLYLFSSEKITFHQVELNLKIIGGKFGKSSTTY